MFGSIYIMDDKDALNYQKYNKKITHKYKKLSASEENKILLKKKNKKENKVERNFIIIDDKKFLRGIR